MEQSSSSGPSHSKVSSTQTEQKPQNSSRNFRSRQHQVERDLPYKDLRELLNHKRQNADGKNPPSDPKYNYLSDPMRDGEASSGTITSSTNSNNYNNNNFGFGRASNRNNFRNSRGRGRSNFLPEKIHQPRPGYSNEPERFVRDWDQGKEDPRNRRYPFKKPQYSEGPSNDTTNFRYQDTRPINTNYKGPPHKYNPNYRGSSQKRFSPRRYPHPDPINISVEYNVEDGFRKCTALDVKLDKVWKKGPSRRFAQQPVPEFEVEENWDEDVTPKNPETEVSRNKPTKKGNTETETPKNDSTKGGNSEIGTSNIEEGIKDGDGVRSKPDGKTPKLRRPKKIDVPNTKIGDSTKPEIAKNPNNPVKKTPEVEKDLTETGGGNRTTLRTNIQPKNEEKSTSEVKGGPVEVDKVPLKDNEGPSEVIEGSAKVNAESSEVVEESTKVDEIPTKVDAEPTKVDAIPTKVDEKPSEVNEELPKNPSKPDEKKPTLNVEDGPTEPEPALEEVKGDKIN